MRIHLLLLFCCSFCFSQNIEKIKESDTLYIFFKGGKGETKLENKSHSNSKFGSIVNYVFYLDKSYYLKFSRSKFLNFDDFTSKKLADVKKVDSKFLKTNRNQILTRKFFNRKLKKSSKENWDWIQKYIKNKKKIFYLIDFDENKKNDIILFEIQPFIDSYNPPTKHSGDIEIKIIESDTLKN